MATQARKKKPTKKQLAVAIVLLSAVDGNRADTVAALLERDGADPNILVEVRTPPVLSTHELSLQRLQRSYAR